MPQVEMGQGIYTAHAMVLAEELDVAWSSVSVEAAPPDTALYANPMLTVQATGNSNSIRAFWKPLRKAAAASRAMLVAAAARQWDVEPATCTADSGEVIHPATERKLSYGALAEAASKETPPDRSAAEIAGGLQADRKAAEAAGHAGQGERQSEVRYRHDAGRA